MNFDPPRDAPPTEGGIGNHQRSAADVLVFVDTNVLLHGKPLDDLPLREIIGGQEPIRVVVTITVLREVDAQKTKNSNKGLRRRAGHILTDFRNREPVGRLELRNGARLLFEMRRHGLDLVELGLDPAFADDHILAEVLRAQRENPLRRCVLLSRDAGPLLHGRSLGIETVHLDDAYCLEVPDEQDRKIRELQDEVSRLKTRRPKLGLELEDGRTFREVAVVRPRPLRDDEIEERIRVAGDACPCLDRQAASRTTAGAPLDQALLEALQVQERFFGVSEAAVDRYNREREEWLAALREHFKTTWLQDEALGARSFSLELHLRNSGSAAATDVQVALTFPHGVTPSREDPRRYRSPSPPEKPQRLLDPALRGLTPSVFDRIHSRSGTEPNVQGPWITEDGHSHVVTFAVTKARHQYDYTLPTVFVTLPGFDEIDSFRIEASIFAAELPELVVSPIDLRITMAG